MFTFWIGFIEVTWIDIADILLVTFLLYQLYKLMRGSVALKIFVGGLSIYMTYLVVKALEMDLLTRILGEFIGVGVIAALILFQQEIRRFLLMIGRTSFLNRALSLNVRSRSKQYDLKPVIDAVKTMSGAETGALIVFTRGSDLKYYLDSGEALDAHLSRKLLLAIFNKYSPLHDGAVIISNGKIKAARCILPVSESDDLPTNLGLRHRSALGITEHTDSVVLVVSEEAGSVSIADHGRLMYDIPLIDLHERLSELLFDKPITSPQPIPASAVQFS